MINGYIPVLLNRRPMLCSCTCMYTYIRGATIHRYTGVPRFLGPRYTPRYVFANIVDRNFFRFSVQRRVKLTLSTVLDFRLVDNCDMCQHLAMCFSTVSLCARLYQHDNQRGWRKKVGQEGTG